MGCLCETCRISGQQQTENDLLKKEISRKEKIIEKQNNIIFNRISKSTPSKKDKSFIRYIDLD